MKEDRIYTNPLGLEGGGGRMGFGVGGEEPMARQEDR